MARYGYAPKVRVNAGGMTANQENKILELLESKAWEFEPNASYRERVAMIANDGPRNTDLTGGWNGTASKLIAYLIGLPDLADYVPNSPAAIVDDNKAERELADSENDPWDGDVLGDSTADNFDAIVDAADEIVNLDGLQELRSELNTPLPDKPMVGPGVYVYDGTFFAVKESRQNPGRHYAYLIRLVGGKFKHSYAKGMIYKLTNEMRASSDVVVAMNRDTIRTDAKGRRVGSCCVCGRMLTKKSSVDAGIGPICGGRVGL